jgi:membrane protein DedA with SNARE-associated domain
MLMALENVFPPIPSELIMPFAGFVAARGDLNGVGVVLAGAAGSLAGTLPWYWLGWRIGRERLGRWVGRHGRWLTMSSEDLTRAEDWLHRHGGMAVMLGRLVPALRSVISMPAGVTRMPLLSFLAWSSIGTLVWTTALASLGWVLQSNYGQVSAYLEVVTRVVLGLFVGAYLWRVLRFKGG